MICNGLMQTSLLLWQSVLCASAIQNLLVVGAFRDVEIGPDHLLWNFIGEVESARVRITRLHLKNLELMTISNYIAAALASDPADIIDLTYLVYMRTSGNPYFSNEFLKSLYKDHLLTFNLVEQKWRWDIKKIRDYRVASDILELFINKILDLDKNTQQMLGFAALIGRRFDAATLLAVYGPERANILADSLWRAMAEGLIYPLDENYRFLASENAPGILTRSGKIYPSLADKLQEEILFEFQHDRVQQAAIAIMDEYHLMAASLQIGWTLLEQVERVGQESLQENLLGIVGYLDNGRALLKDRMN